MRSRTSQTLLQHSATSTKFRVDTAVKRNTSNDRVIKRRAPRACQCCRERKVRCNIVEYGPPCTNCRLDNVICIAAENKRKTRHIFSYTKLQHRSLERPGSHKPRFGIPELEINLNTTVSPTDICNYDLEYMSDAGSFMNGGEIFDTALCDFQETICQTRIEGLNGSDYSPILDFDKPSPSLSLGLLDPSNLLGSNMPTIQDILFETPLLPAREELPSYIMEFPSHLTTDETDILLRKSALSVPEDALRSRLLQAYIEYVHPCMPLINVNELLRTIEANGRSGRISLILFQSIMFAGTTFIDMDHLHAVGFANRREAQYTFYQKCRILYDVDYETDYIALIQSLLLVANSNSHYSPDDPKCSRHWLDIAISLSYRIGLHSNLGKFKLDVKKQRLLKRVWWSCLMQDRLVALETRGLVRIKDDDFDIPMLTLEDFEIEALPRDNCVISPELSLIRDKRQQTELALICIEKAKLCLCVGHVINLQYSVICRDYYNSHKYRPDSNTKDLQDTSVPSIPQTRLLKHLNRVRDCDSELSTWAKNLPLRFHLDEISPPSKWLNQHSIEHQRQLASKTKVLLLHQSLLHILHSAAVMALHEPQQSFSPSTTNISTDTDTVSNEHELHDLSLLRVHESCRTIATLTLKLHTLHLVTHLPTTAITMLVPALIRHLSDLYTSVPLQLEDSYRPYDAIYSREDSGGDDYEIYNAHDDKEEDTGFTKRQRWIQCVQLLESIQNAFPNIAICHTISVLGVAAATSRFQRAGLEPCRAVTMRNARREEMLRTSSGALIEEETGSCCSGCESETSCGSVDSVSARSRSLDIVNSGGCANGSIGSHSIVPIDEMDVEAFPAGLSIVTSGDYNGAHAVARDLREKYLM